MYHPVLGVAWCYSPGWSLPLSGERSAFRRTPPKFDAAAVGASAWGTSLAEAMRFRGWSGSRSPSSMSSSTSSVPVGPAWPTRHRRIV